ncbi:hypothetical protein PPERSA_12849 [Pseudocohnilembus persalinus]|uniref:Uncharacterized protein n=1 Tax=Pseudocohnilembus persalinus TaxID=266149 RepID=A0A0V0QVY2_PSEPJ|nr:hypothetical protein PPERSA_12849 [Pseudocohnilembus persalinus]|eukprot:KRX06160.1 hypothetical protein PPERSA_12849 [Pseudocohnilembus persalinus]
MGCQQGKVSSQVKLSKQIFGKNEFPQFDRETYQSTNIAYTSRKIQSQKKNNLFEEILEENHSQSQDIQQNSIVKKIDQNAKSKSSSQFEKQEISPYQKEHRNQFKSLQKIEEKPQYNKKEQNNNNINKNKIQIKYSLSDSRPEFKSEQQIRNNNQQQQDQNLCKNTVQNQQFNDDDEILERQIQEYEQEQRKKQENQGQQKSENSNNEQQNEIKQNLGDKREQKKEKEMQIIQEQLEQYRNRQIKSLSEIESCVDSQLRKQLCSLGEILPKYQVTEEYVQERKKLKQIHDNAIPVLDSDIENSFLAIKRDLHIRCQIKKIKQVQAKQNNYQSKDSKSQVIDQRLKKIYELE